MPTTISATYFTGFSSLHNAADGELLRTCHFVPRILRPLPGKYSIRLSGLAQLAIPDNAKAYRFDNPEYNTFIPQPCCPKYPHLGYHEEGCEIFTNYFPVRVFAVDSQSMIYGSVYPCTTSSIVAAFNES